MVGLITGDLGVPFVPDDHRAGTACLPGPDPLIITGGQGVVLDRHGQPPDTRIERGSFGNRPGSQDLAEPDPQIEMQRRRVMDLHHEARHGHGATLQPGRSSPQRGQPKPGHGLMKQTTDLRGLMDGGKKA